MQVNSGKASASIRWRRDISETYVLLCVASSKKNLQSFERCFLLDSYWKRKK